MIGSIGLRFLEQGLCQFLSFGQERPESIEITLESAQLDRMDRMVFIARGGKNFLFKDHHQEILAPQRLYTAKPVTSEQ